MRVKLLDTGEYALRVYSWLYLINPKDKGYFNSKPFNIVVPNAE